MGCMLGVLGLAIDRLRGLKISSMHSGLYRADKGIGSTTPDVSSLCMAKCVGLESVCRRCPC